MEVCLTLEEQVAYNKDLIEHVLETGELLSKLGIKVVGKVDNANELPDAKTYTGNYGDAYEVGINTPYSLYIFTRPFHNDVYPTWFNIGPFPLPGPQGIQGAKGDTGDRGPKGSKWYYGTINPSVENIYEVKDFYLNSTNGNVFEFDGVSWNKVANIQGPQGIMGRQGIQGQQGIQGPQGPQGIRGPVGDSFTIIGRLTSESQLPTPTESIRQDAYIIADSTNNDFIYYIVGKDVLSWEKSRFTGSKGPQGPQGPEGQQGIQGVQGPIGPQGPAGGVSLITLDGTGNISRSDMDNIIANPSKYEIILNNKYFRFNYALSNDYFYTCEILDKPNIGDTYIYQLTINSNGLTYDVTDNDLARDSDLTNLAKVNGNNLTSDNANTFSHNLAYSNNTLNNNAVGFAESEKLKSQNLFNKNAEFVKFGFNKGTTELLDNGNIKATANFNESHGPGLMIDVKPNTQYTISFDVVEFEGGDTHTPGVITIYSVPEDAELRNVISNTLGQQVATFNTRQHTKIFISICGQRVDGDLKYVIYNNIQIQEGTTASPYQPYNGNIVHEKDFKNAIGIDVDKWKQILGIVTE